MTMGLKLVIDTFNQYKTAYRKAIKDDHHLQGGVR